MIGFTSRLRARCLLFCLVFGLATCALAPFHTAHAQRVDAAAWYNPEAPHLRIAVVADGVYRLSAQALSGALPSGTRLSDIAPESLRLLVHGREVPLHLTGTTDGRVDPSDRLTFIGHRNRGTDEGWAYPDPQGQSSTYYSLYTDTTYYWLTWGGAPGRRYTSPPSPVAQPPQTTIRDTVHAEQDTRYYYGRSNESGNPFYTTSEGYFWRRFTHNTTGSIPFDLSLPTQRRVASASETLQLTVRLDAASSSCHQVALKADLGGANYETLETVEWRGAQRQTITASIAQDRLPDGPLALRIVSTNANFALPNCPPPASTPNYVLLDWVEATYTRNLSFAANGTQSFAVAADGPRTFTLSNTPASAFTVWSPATGARYRLTPQNTTATFTADLPAGGATFHAVSDAAYRTPAAVVPDTPSNWGTPSAHAAEYVIITTQALRPSAERLASYRRSETGLSTAIVRVQDLFDEFDYGQPTPRAIRRFVHSTRQWSTPPRFVTIWADAQFPIETEGLAPRPPWSVPSYGFSPSDPWFAMQYAGPNDWTEIVAIGRVPVRSNAQGDLFLEKLRTYEQAPLDAWQQRMLLLAGGVRASEQQSLQFYSNRWGELATGTPDSLYAAGMDTLRYYKRSDEALDISFQDSLAADLAQGAGWLNYFGHSAAQTWEIVTAPPSDFDNAGRLPVVMSIGCRTGAFAGGRFEVRSAPSFGEQLVVGSIAPDGSVEPGALNGGIAHFGSSALSYLLPSARINEAVNVRVFTDTMRVLGRAVQSAKSQIADQFGSSSFYVRHLLQYGLLGDPATRISIADRPDFRVRNQQVQVSPSPPNVTDRITVAATVRNLGLVPRDSVDVRLRWTRPDGQTQVFDRRVPRFAKGQAPRFEIQLTPETAGTNTFTARADATARYPEANETNNTGAQSTTVFDAGLTLLAPSDVARVSTRRPTLEGSVQRVRRTSVPIVIQLDTTAAFNSPALRTHEEAVDDYTFAWQPSQPLLDNTTYYWRARIASTEGTWQTARFTVATAFAEAGWLQQDPLFQANATTRISYAPQQWSFNTFSIPLEINSERGSGSRNSGFAYGAQNYAYLQFGFSVLVIDERSSEVIASESFPTFDLRDDLEDDVGDQTEAIDKLAAFLDQHARDENLVYVRTRHLGRRSGPQIPDRVKDLFRNLGTQPAPQPYTTAMDTLTYNHLWILATQVGHPQRTIERVSPPGPNDPPDIFLELTPTFPHQKGITTTPAIGPVRAWKSLAWQANAASSTAQFGVSVFSARDSTLLFRERRGLDGTIDLSSIDARAHPRIFLEGTFVDSTSAQAPDLNRWTVGFVPPPELAIDPSTLTFSADTLREGAPLRVDAVVRNLSDTPADAPVVVSYTLTDAQNVSTTVPVDTLAGLEARATASVTFTVPTFNRDGRNQLAVRAHTALAEARTFNNVAVRSFVVQSDARAPVVEVLVEGRALPFTPAALSNLQDPALPFVSTTPTFEIVAQDDNPYASLADTSLYTVAIKGGLPAPNIGLGSPYRRVSFSGPALKLQPPDPNDDSSSVRLLYTPDFTGRDSTYTLKVEARDPQGNAMADPALVTFRVQENQVIEAMYPYPNPMHTHTTFAFRVKGGSTRPENFQLRIYTVAGRLVRTFDGATLNDGLGLRTTGWNMLRWNGRDADGDRVATGVYLYRVRMDAEDGTHSGEIGKVVVIR
ncbi:C25 family cysteine peptidase [Salisaeta longa]|uniref:C25 family cysteine peptidase n=1 Tax=Salisaeta longa TaxID=503170 RepID=UPI0004060646|nr:C25 family cysteine peptidase [Salisaeta longa]